ncbi:MAG: hypothetical protein U0804_04045 [Gemmataceae bacterium]
MPLRDHFRPPLSTRFSWEGVHGGWPMTIVQRLASVLPAGFVAEPRVHLGPYFEIDVAGFDHDDSEGVAAEDDGGGVATAPVVAPPPTLIADGEVATPYEYEALVFDEARGRTLVAAVEIVSPGNKDRPKTRRLFAAKCATLVRQGVCVAVVDVVTSAAANLYTEVLDELRARDPAFLPTPPATYAAAIRRRTDGPPTLEAWAYALEVGRVLPMLPLWLTETVWVPLELEASYEDTCRALRIP